ncbi:MAG: hypothetical protein ACKVH8_17695 [Pirellulales bacterium]
MRLQTHILWSEYWDFLRTEDHIWKNNTEFQKWIQQQPEVEASLNETWITKQNHEEPWGPENCRLVNIWSDSDYNKVLKGAFQGGHNG